MPANSITVPVIQTIKSVVGKDLFTSKKFKLAINLLMWALVSWGSIPDCSRLVYKMMILWKNGNYRQLVIRSILNFTLMAVKFFIRRLLVVFVIYITM